MKLYIYHLPGHATMWAVLADSQAAAMRLISQQKGVKAVLVKVLSGNGDGILIPADESIILQLNKDSEHGK